MKSKTFSLWLLAALMLSSCGESKAPSASGDSSTSSGETSLVAKARELTRGALASVEKLDWDGFKNKLTEVDLSNAKKALEGVDLAAAKTRYDELALALSKKDYAQAEFYAKKLDELLASDLVSKSIEFLKVESEKGSDAAIQAVKAYIDTPGLRQSSKEFGEKMLGYFQSVEVNRDDVEGVLFWATFYIVRSHVPINDSHLQDAVAMLAASAIPRGFHAYDLHTKEGVELSDAILRSLGSNKDDAGKIWNEIVKAGRKGVDNIKKELTEKSAHFRGPDERSPASK
ncbi:hypothetical protein [Roseimicrobium sp. ORNL1]|uniref:hypothetical protein n=1 Tax=Roseimicrobium sp. ORNL1 TaxID=2711231 RepID=UPI0013E13BC0|nr:hypothetical protein [Roseimicrobium sp. ORNL1]QIF01114.1 hypothetical protein G5S37_06140 [Roseimicrobium sp. ORNL1]